VYPPSPMQHVPYQILPLGFPIRAIAALVV
jgi:hypothetical protein